jgi:hypothetical protein
MWTRDHGRLDALASIEHVLWSNERAARSTALRSLSKRLPVYLNAIEAPEFATRAAVEAVDAGALAAQTLEPRERALQPTTAGSGATGTGRGRGPRVVLPFLTAIAGCFADGLFAAALLRRGTSTRTIRIARPRLRTRGGDSTRRTHPRWSDPTEAAASTGRHCGPGADRRRPRPAHRAAGRADRQPEASPRDARTARLGALPRRRERRTCAARQLRQAPGRSSFTSTANHSPSPRSATPHPSPTAAAAATSSASHS